MRIEEVAEYEDFLPASYTVSEHVSLKEAARLVRRSTAFIRDHLDALGGNKGEDGRYQVPRKYLWEMLVNQGYQPEGAALIVNDFSMSDAESRSMHNLADERVILMSDMDDREAAARVRAPAREVAGLIAADMESSRTPKAGPKHYSKADLLEAAKNAVADRGLNYGRPEDNFNRIALLWNAHLVNINLIAPRSEGISAGDVAQMMALMKIARLENQPNHADSWIDLAGYAACGADIST